MKSNAHCELWLKNWKVDVRLGVTVEERANAQTVAIDIVIRFEGMPPACKTDKLEDTACYDSLLSALRVYLINQEYNLIEHLAYAVGQKVHELLPGDSLVRINVAKLHPPVAGLESANFAINEY